METLGANSAAEQTQNRDDNDVPREDFGALQHGCDHYRRRCKLKAPCCDQIFTCRHCHNEATVVCAICNTEQQVSNLCSNCGVKFGEYFCNICKFYDDDISKNQFHCNDCGICRYRCPICSKSVFNMSNSWERLDEEIAATAMPEEYRYEVENLCNDCNHTSKTFFHIFGHKCQHCNSYNTRVITSGETGNHSST
ncbi:hypothetical protein SASPL_100034 [Salvia splendens]|uniref:RING finger and CHY zinc finger domain-containing protein 1 n=1 Tax=Salvia splendens TaxID=180675 RepID=A0A8X8YLM5_SALSN|nr:hypothetical protein SASPL_100034 [Salvia splendens]